MTANLRNGLVAALLAGGLGCSRTTVQPAGEAEPMAIEAVSRHWQAIRQGDWKSAYGRLHPDLKGSGLTLKRFTDLHGKRRGVPGLPQDIRILGSERTGADVVVSYDVLIIPPQGGEPVPVPPRRRATLRKNGDSWGLMTHDILAAGLGGG